MFQLRDLFNSNIYDLLKKMPSLEEKLKDRNFPLEDYLKDDEAISCIKLMGKNTKKYFDSEKIKRLIKLITEEPEEEDHLKGHKFPYIASEILKCDCPFISKRFILNEQEYDEEYPETIEDGNKDEKEIDFDFYKNEFDNDFSKIEEKLKKLKKKKDGKNESNNENEEVQINEAEKKNENNDKDIGDDDNEINNEHENKNEENNDETKDDDVEIKDEINNEINKDREGIDDKKVKYEFNDINNEENKKNNQLPLENINDAINKQENDKGIYENNKNEENLEEAKKESKEENNYKDGNSNEISKDKKEEKENKEEKEEKEEKEVKESNENKNIKDLDNQKDKDNNDKEIKEKAKEKKDYSKKENEIDNNNNNEEENIEKNKEEKENGKINEVNEEIKDEIKESKEEKEEKEIKTEKNSELEKEDIKELNEDKEKENKNEKKEGKEGKEKEMKEEEIKDEQALKEDDIEKEQDNNQEEECNEELEENVIVDKEAIEVDSEEKEEKNKKNENEENKKEDEDSLSIEGEIEDFYTIKKQKPKKKYENKPNNEYLDLLLEFVMNDKPELNYVLSGYFANVMITLINNYPSQILKYLYTQRKDALKKIINHSNQKAFAILSLKILNLESYITVNNITENNLLNIISSNIDYRNELIKETIKSINLEGYKGEDGQVDRNVDIEAKFALVSDIINENKEIATYLINNNEAYTHMFDILGTELYNNENNSVKDTEDNFNNKYFIYELFIELITKLLKTACSSNIINYPTEPLINYIDKEKKEISFSEYLVKTFIKIINSNFLPKRNLIIEKNSSLAYEGLGMLNIKIMELIQEMMNFMKEIPNQFDNILMRNNFWQKSIDYFFKYQWNNIYHNHFVEFFNSYLLTEENHKTTTYFLFNNLKFHEILLNYLNQEKEKDNKDKNPRQKLVFVFKSGKSTKNGIYPHVIDLIYKIQSIRGLAIFTAEEKINLKIKNYGELEFSKDEKSNKFVKKINASENINKILKDSKEWNDTTNEIVLPLIKKYEEQLCKKEEKKRINSDNDLDDDIGPSKFKDRTTEKLLAKLLNTIKGGTSNSIKRFSLPLSRNDKNVGKPKIDIKSSIRDKLLNKGQFHIKKIFDDDEDDKKKDDNKDDENKNEENTEENKEYSDNNYWGISNNLPENIKKEVDKKTNIIFNYNPITCENDNKNDVTEEDEILSVAIGLERKEKMEKNKKLKLALPYRIKPFNLKAKTNPVPNIYSSGNEQNTLKKNNYIKDKYEDNEKVKDENTGNGENEENEEEEEGVVKKEEKEERNEGKGEIEKKEMEEIEKKLIIKEDKEENNKEENIDKEKEKDDKNYNDVNYWGISSRVYLNEKEMEECLNDL